MAKKIPLTAVTPLSEDNKCFQCQQSLCCHYITQNIDAPRSMADFDLLIWQISHENVRLFKDSTGWFLMFETRCSHLSSQGECGIYTQRPFICREHSNDYCEYDIAIPDSSELYFHDYAALDKYCRKRFKGWDKRFERRKKAS